MVLSLEGLIPGSCLLSGSLLVPPFPSQTPLPPTPRRNRPESPPEDPLLSPPAEFAGFGLCWDPAGVFTQPLAGKPPSGVPVIYSCAGGGWRTSKSSSDVCAPAAGVDAVGINPKPLHQQASRGHRRLSAGAAGKTSSAAPHPPPGDDARTQGCGHSYMAALNLPKRRWIIGSSSNKC